jgi:hypothetical protein
MDSLISVVQGNLVSSLIASISIPLLICWIRSRPRSWVSTSPHTSSTSSFPCQIRIPVVGFADPVLSYIIAYQMVFKGRDILRSAYQKHKEGLFLLPGFQAWTVYVCGPKLIEEISQLPTETLSLMEASKEVCLTTLKMRGMLIKAS